MSGVMMWPVRFRDPGGRVSRYLGRVLVRCPACDRCALVVRPEVAGNRYVGNPKLTCVHCGLARERRTWHQVIGAPVDPFFRLPLWLQTPCCGETMWAYNAEHLGVLEGYVGAGLRERPAASQPYTMLEILPRWMKLAKHRDEVLRAISRLKQSLAS